MIRSIITAMLIIIAFISFNFGMDWINFNHGWHPAIAFPIATVTFIGACIIGQLIEFINS